MAATTWAKRKLSQAATHRGRCTRPWPGGAGGLPPIPHTPAPQTTQVLARQPGTCCCSWNLVKGPDGGGLEQLTKGPA